MYLQTAEIRIFTVNSAGKKVGERVLDLKSVGNPKGLNFGFSFEKKKFDFFGEASIQLFNIGDDTFSALTKRNPSNPFINTAQITCEAGYQGKNSLIFSGTVYDVITTVSRGETITDVTVSTYSDSLSKRQVSIEYRSPPRLSKALKDIASRIGMVVDSSKLATKDDIKIGQKSFKGTITDFLTREAAHNTGFSVDYRSDTVFIQSLEQELSSSNIMVISSKTGMILSPTITSENLVKVPMLFNPAVQVGKPVTIITKKILENRGDSIVTEFDEFRNSEITRISGEIYKMKHDFTQPGSTTEIEVLPKGQVSAMNNIGIGI